MFSTEVLIAFVSTSFLLSLAPGPDNIFVLTQSALYGARAGIATTCGLMTGISVHAVAVILGIAALIHASVLAFTLLKCLGAGYLLYLAWLSLRAGSALAITTGNESPGKGGSASHLADFPGYFALYRRGIIMSASNPKLILFFLAFLPQFCDPQKGDLAWQVVILVALFILVAIFVFFAVALLGGRLAIWFNRSPRGQIAIHRIAAIVFAGLAVALLFTTD